MTHYKFSPWTYDDLGYSGGRSISVKVHGFWTDVISIWVQRDWSDRAARVERDWLDKPNWKVTISHSSGGRDTKVVASDAEAERNFAHALLAAADVVDMIYANIHLVEAGYQRRSAEYKQEAELAKKQKEAKIAADPALGIHRAKEMIERISADDASCRSIVVYARGADRHDHLRVRVGMKTRFYFNDDSISKQFAIEMLSQASVRSNLKEEYANA